MKKALVAILVILPFLFTSPASAEDDVKDHLKCRGIEAGTKIKTKVEIEGLDERFDARRCRLHRARLLCSAAARTGMDPSPELEFVDGDELPGDYVCYKSKCKTRPQANRATDAFGSRRIGKLQSKLLCVPTIEEPAA